MSRSNTCAGFFGCDICTDSTVDLFDGYGWNDRIVLYLYTCCSDTRDLTLGQIILVRGCGKKRKRRALTASMQANARTHTISKMQAEVQATISKMQAEVEATVSVYFGFACLKPGQRDVIEYLLETKDNEENVVKRFHSQPCYW